ncbi:MAG: hypothetical protein Ta2G_08660 [Termitinemataceae bacterium]|nr:MAG: hypothetical protein Ta2G_08660 [Termitinemataceae bacterium]
MEQKYSNYMEKYSTILFKYVYWTFVPRVFKNFLLQFTKWHNLKKEVIQYLSKEVEQTHDSEKIEALEWLKKNPIAVSLYNPSVKYKMSAIRVYKDHDMRYVLYENKRLYFPVGWEKLRVKNEFYALLREQEINSPHRYEHEKYCVKENDIVVDLGAAEGIFSLHVIEKAAKIYLFECDEMWLPALRKTFEPWKEKIVIVNKYISDHTDNTNLTMDNFIAEIGENINFIKADIEGAELQLLKGADNLITNSKNICMALCTYHRKEDEKDLKQILQEKGFTTEYSKNYMLYFERQDLTPPYLRRGIIRAIKN